MSAFGTQNFLWLLEKHEKEIFLLFRTPSTPSEYWGEYWIGCFICWCDIRGCLSWLHMSRLEEVILCWQAIGKWNVRLDKLIEPRATVVLQSWLYNGFINVNNGFNKSFTNAFYIHSEPLVRISSCFSSCRKVLRLFLILLLGDFRFLFMVEEPPISIWLLTFWSNAADHPNPCINIHSCRLDGWNILLYWRCNNK